MHNEAHIELAHMITLFHIFVKFRNPCYPRRLVTCLHVDRKVSTIQFPLASTLTVLGTRKAKESKTVFDRTYQEIKLKLVEISETNKFFSLRVQDKAHNEFDSATSVSYTVSMTLPTHQISACISPTLSRSKIILTLRF